MSKAATLSKCAAISLSAFLIVSASIVFAQDGLPDLEPAPPPNENHVPEDELGEIMDLVDKPIESLTQQNVVVPALDAEVSTVSRTESTVGRSPAAVFVVTNEMIRRSGARTIPDVLRLVPGVQVAQIDANKWAVTIRGFNGRYANKLLVQIDGRSVYTPLFAGVYWEVQDVVLEDVERIEVIRGPGAVVWGANAVNGVVNIITKSARDTQGSFVQAGSGTEERGFSTARTGGKIGRNAYYRVYGKWFERDRGGPPSEDPQDEWRQGRAGFRVDWEPNTCDTLTFQGDVYDGTSGAQNRVPDSTSPFWATIDDDLEVRGGNALLRWSRTIDEETDWALQFYYDRTSREAIVTDFLEDRDTIDLDFQHHFPLAEDHSFIWGFGYRNTKDAIRSAPFYLGFYPAKRADDLFSYFVQDEITLREDLFYLTVGSKFEHNDYTGFEFQPTVRLLWTPDPRHSVWAAVSRAVRTPSRGEDDIEITDLPVAVIGGVPVFPVFYGDRDFESESVLAYEAGIRGQPTDAFYWDVAVFFNQYEDLVGAIPQSAVPGLTPDGTPALFVPGWVDNVLSGETYGIELATTYEFCPQWRLQAAYTYLYLVLHGEPGAEPLALPGVNPRNQFNLMLSGDLRRDLHIDLIGRYVDSQSEPFLPNYFAMDVRLSWQMAEDLEVFVVGRNLLDPGHYEYARDALTGVLATEVQQEVYGGITWRF